MKESRPDRRFCISAPLFSQSSTQTLIIARSCLTTRSTCCGQNLRNYPSGACRMITSGKDGERGEHFTPDLSSGGSVRFIARYRIGRDHVKRDQSFWKYTSTWWSSRSEYDQSCVSPGLINVPATGLVYRDLRIWFSRIFLGLWHAMLMLNEPWVIILPRGRIMTSSRYSLTRFVFYPHLSMASLCLTARAHT